MSPMRWKLLGTRLELLGMWLITSQQKSNTSCKCGCQYGTQYFPSLLTLSGAFSWQMKSTLSHCFPSTDASHHFLLDHDTSLGTKYLYVSSDYIGVWCISSGIYVPCTYRSQKEVLGIKVPFYFSFLFLVFTSQHGITPQTVEFSSAHLLEPQIWTCYW